MPVISFSLDPASIGQAIRELKRYTDDLPQKMAEVRRRIGEEIRFSAERGFSSAMVSDVFMGYVPQNDVTVSMTSDDTATVVIADGTQAVFMEFGAGVHYNGNPGDSPHPWGILNGYGIGTYGKGKGVNDTWGYYTNGDKTKLTLTHGTPAAMPLYHGTEEAVRKIGDILGEVFGND